MISQFFKQGILKVSLTENVPQHWKHHCLLDKKPERCTPSISEFEHEDLFKFDESFELDNYKKPAIVKKSSYTATRKEDSQSLKVESKSTDRPQNEKNKNEGKL